MLYEATRRARGDGAVRLVAGNTGFAERMEALRIFNERPACHVLLLAVGACASGLTLTVANHCLLLDLQAHEGKELQLINRVWRIGQPKPVTIKRLVASGTVEERMLHLRKRSKGLMASDDADTMAVGGLDAGDAPATSGGSKGKGKVGRPSQAASVAAEAAEARAEDLRYLLGA